MCNFYLVVVHYWILIVNLLTLYVLVSSQLYSIKLPLTVTVTCIQQLNVRDNLCAMFGFYS